MREFRTSGSVRGAASNGRPYRELISRAGATGNSRATLPLVALWEGREVGALCWRSRGYWLRSSFHSVSNELEATHS